MSEQHTPTPIASAVGTASAVGPCPTLIKSSRTLRHWKFTQHHRATRPPYLGTTFLLSTLLGKLQVPGRPANLDYSKARASVLAESAGGGCLDIFSLIYHFSYLSPSIWQTARYRLQYCLKGPLSQNNQPTPPQAVLAVSHLAIQYAST